jgi:AcrR family transcriptional regulator
MTATQETPSRGVRLPRRERRAQLLLAAREVFVARGYHAAAMDEIAERAGVSKPVLYQHFPGKRDLYLALLDSSVDAFVDRVRAALSSTEDNKRRVDAAVRAYFEYIDADDGSFRLLFENDLTGQPEVRERLESLTQRCAEAIAEVIASDTGLGPDESHLLAAGLVGMAQVSARYWLGTEEALPRDDATGLVATLGWRGIGGFPRRGEHDGEALPAPSGARRRGGTAQARANATPEPAPQPSDASPTDTGPTDTGPTDTGSSDTGPTDTGPGEATRPVARRRARPAAERR